jgi:hypothetical protein
VVFELKLLKCVFDVRVGIRQEKVALFVTLGHAFLANVSHREAVL